jgi:hypothetical protein
MGHSLCHAAFPRSGLVSDTTSGEARGTGEWCHLDRGHSGAVNREGTVEKGGEGVLSLTQRLALNGTQALYPLRQVREFLLEGKWGVL